MLDLKKVVDKTFHSALFKFHLEKNSPPVAHAGGDQSVTLPKNAIYLNGSQSTDDLGIVKYEWTRDGTSLAIGTIVGQTDHEPILIVRLLFDLIAQRH